MGALLSETSSSVPPAINARLSYSHAILRRKSMAASPLHLTIVCGFVSSVSRSLHLPDLQQSLLKALQLTNPLALSHWRETLQVSTPGMWKGVQRPKQHEEA